MGRPNFALWKLSAGAGAAGRALDGCDGAAGEACAIEAFALALSALERFHLALPMEWYAPPIPRPA